MTERRDGKWRERILVLAALVLCAAAFVIALPGDDDAATPARRERAVVPEEEAAVVATSTAVEPPIVRQEAPQRSPAPVPATTLRKDTLRTELYPVKDLVFGAGARSSVNDLAVMLSQATGPDYWRSPGRSLTVEDSGVLAVTANPDMHRKVAGMLTDMRRSPAARR